MGDVKASDVLKRLDAATGGKPSANGITAQSVLDKLDAIHQQTVIATTDDGGRVTRGQDGALSFASPGYSTNDQARIAEIMNGAKPVDLVQGDLDRERIAANPVAARVQEFNQGAPLVGEWLDEGVGMVAPQAADSMRKMSDAMERQHPGQSVGLNVAGGIAYSAPLIAGAVGSRAADWISRGSNTVMRGGRAALASAPVGVVEGAAALSGRADDGNRATAAGIGAAVGGGLAAILGPVASMTGEAVVSLAKRVKRLDVRTIADEFGLSMPAARAVKKALAADDLNAASTRLRNLGDDAMLADAGQSTAALLDAGMATGGKSLSVGRKMIDERASAAGKRLPGVLDTILGIPQGVKTAARGISKGTAAARKAAYDRAFSRPIDYAAQTGRDIEGVLSRIPARTLKAAIDEANDQMKTDGLVNLQIMAEIAPDGSVVFREMPNVQQLDAIKQALGTVGAEAVDKFGRQTKQGLRAGKLARDLRDAIVSAVPEYRTAIKLGGDKIEMDNALALGKTILGRGTTVEDVRDFLAGGVSREARAMLRQGVRENIEQTLSNVRRTITDASTDARELMQFAKDMSSRANLEKMQMVLGKQKANQLLQELDKMMAALELRAAVATNSKTAIRQGIQDQVRAEAAPGVVRRTVGNLGAPLEAPKDLTQTLMGIDARSLSEAEKGLYDEIATKLVTIRGDDARKALIAVRKAMRGQPMKDADAQLIGSLVGNTTGVSLYQTGKQNLAGR